MPPSGLIVAPCEQRHRHAFQQGGGRDSDDAMGLAPQPPITSPCTAPVERAGRHGQDEGDRQAEAAGSP